MAATMVVGCCIDPLAKYGQLQGVGLNEFDGFNGALRIFEVDIDNHDLGPQVLNLAENRVSRSRREADIAKYYARKTSGLQPGAAVPTSVPGPRSGGLLQSMHARSR